MCSAKLEDHSATVLRWKQRRKVAPPHRGKGTISSRFQEYRVKKWVQGNGVVQP